MLAAAISRAEAHDAVVILDDASYAEPQLEITRPITGRHERGSTEPTAKRRCRALDPQRPGHSSAP
jgi:hypothetical protein